MAEVALVTDTFGGDVVRPGAIVSYRCPRQVSRDFAVLSATVRSTLDQAL